MTNKQELREAAEKHGADDILALLDELEAAQSYAKDRDEENQDLMLTVGRLRVEKEAAEKRIAELEGIATSPRPYQVEPGRWECPTCHYQGHESAVYAALCVFCSNKYKGED